MEKIRIICVGKLKEPFYLQAQEEYRKRLSRSCQLEILELPEQRLPEDPSPAQIQKALAAEAEAILPRIAGHCIALCIEGKPCASEVLSQRMQELAALGQSPFTFLIGGSVGLAETVKARADWKLSLSPMTFPHHLARVMLLEQIYRSYQIRLGSRYHK